MTPATACQELFDILVSNKFTFATAESLTGGMIAEHFTAIPGSSEYIWGGIVSYTPEAKMKLLNVSQKSIQDHTVVSAEVAREMLEGILFVSGANTAVAVTGVAGPGGGTKNIPVGSVWIAAGKRTNTIDALTQMEVQLFHFLGDRNSVREQTVVAACNLLIKLMRGKVSG